VPVSLLPFPYTDTGNAERLLAAFPAKFLYSPETNRWFTWTGKLWRRDSLQTIYSYANATIREFLRQTNQIADPIPREIARKFAIRSESAQSQEAMIRQFHRLHGTSILQSRFDRHPYLLNLDNGILDLRAGQLLPHAPSRLLSKTSSIKFDPSATCPLFLSFLDRIMASNENLISYLQTIFGYSLTGDVSERAVFCLFGNGSNGKTTLLRVIRHILGDYAASVMIKSIMDNRESDSLTTTSDIANLQGARFATTSEAKQRQKLSEHLIKYLTSTDKLRACHKYQDPFEFEPTHKLFIDTNHRPEVTGTDLGIWSRLHLIPFTTEVPKASQDPELYFKLIEESPGILNWMLNGCLRWSVSRLNPPSEVTSATSAWKVEDDLFSEFFTDCCEFTPKYFTPTSQINDEFKKWCEQEHIKMPSYLVLNDRLRKMEAVMDRAYLPEGNRVRVWKNVRLTQYAINYPNQPT